MTKDEWRRLVEHIYRAAILPRLGRRLHRFHPFEYFERYPWRLHRLARTMQVLRFIEDYFDDDDELTEAFTPAFLADVLDALSDGLAWNERLVVDTGVSESIQKHFGEIVDGMDADDMPEEDVAILRLSGSHDPHQELRILVRKVKDEKEVILKRHQEGGFSVSLRRTRERVIEKKKQLGPETSAGNQPPKKRWLKGLGGICQGTMLTIVDTSLIAGIWTIPLPLETKTVGAVVSITSGIGSILTGFGELHGE